MSGPGRSADPPSPTAELDDLLGASGMPQILDALAESVTVRDGRDRIVYANRAALEQLGFDSLDELVTIPPGEIMADWIVENEAGGPVVMADIPSVRLLAGELAEPLVMRSTNRRTGVIRWSKLVSAPLYDLAGRRVAAVTGIENITAEKLAELRGRFLARASATLMSSIDYQETLRHVAWLMVPELADWCAVDLVDDSGSRQHVAIAHRDPGKALLAHELEQRRATVLDPDRGLGRVVRSGQAELYPVVTPEMVRDSPQGDAEYRRLIEQIGMRSVLVCPLNARGRALGAVTLVNAESYRRFDQDDLALVEQVAAAAGVAVDNARLATERRMTAATLQQSLLPGGLPSIAGWEVAAAYRPGGEGEETEVGGDFYDFFETPRGWLLLLGDVAGKGVPAAAMTGLVRHGARFLAKQLLEPIAIFTELDLALRERSELALCTAICARLEPGRVVLAVAGHPAPLILRDDGELREVGASGPILGAWSGATWEQHITSVGPDETLVLYTDGVTDVPGEVERFGIGRLEQCLVQHAGLAPQALLAALEAELVHFYAGGPTDDTAIVALRPSGSGQARAHDVQDPQALS